MQQNIDYGVILAAGSGSRLYPLSKYFPKITLPVFDKPLIIHHFEIMQMVGIKKVFIVVSDNNYEIISMLIEKAEHFNIDFEFVIQSTPNGTGHAVWLLKEKLTNSRFLMLLGDEYYTDISSFSEIPNINGYDNILGIVKYQNTENILSGCNILMKDNLVVKLIEKPTKEKIVGKWCWDGSVVLSDKIFDVLDEMSIEFNKGKSKIMCIVKAMQLLLDKGDTISYFKKSCSNINITFDIDLVKANMIECIKKYDKSKVEEIINQFN